MRKELYLISALAIFIIACEQPQNNEPSKSAEFILSDTSVIARPIGYEYSEKETFSVLSWNVEHFVDPYDDPYIDHPRENEPGDKMSSKVSLLVKALRKANADVVVLQEFESEKYLMTLARDSFPELGYQFFSDAASPDWYMNVVLMSRFPMGVLQAYGDVTTPVLNYVDEEGKKETQSHINTRMWTAQIFPSESYEFWLTAVHLKAGRGERNSSMRLGQVNFLQTQFDKIQHLNPSANLMMAGDFNAYPNSPELRRLTDKGHVTPLIDPLDSAVMSHPADEPQRRLDYLLVNPNMEKEMLANAVQVVNFFSADSMRMISDHLPVMGEFYRRERE